MALDRVELFIRWADVVGKESTIEQMLRELPGVTSVGPVTQEETTAEARIWVEFDPRQTNPIILEDALVQHGVTVLSAAERS